MWTDLLTANGVDLRTLDAATVVLGDSAPVSLVHLNRPMRRRDLDRIQSRDAPGLLVAQSINANLRPDLEAAGWSWIDEDDDRGVVLQLDGLVLDDDDQDAQEAPTFVTSEWPRGLSTFAIVRTLLLTPAPSRQQYLVKATGYSQPLVSRTLNRLKDDSLVVKSRDGWAARDWSDLAHWWLERYRGPGGVRRRFATSLDPWSAARQILDAAVSAGIRIAFSGAIAADATAPWAEPTSVVCYTNEHLELDDTDLVESADSRASVQIIVPADNSVWPSPSKSNLARQGNPVPLTDLLQTAWHIRTDGGRSSSTQLSRILEHSSPPQWAGRTRLR